MKHLRLSRRRFFITTAVTAAAAAAGIWFMPRSREKISGSLLGPSTALGHKLRDGFNFPEPVTTEQVDIAIVGGGISGLAAGYRLKSRTSLNFRLLELEPEIGGNARAGGNAISRYPWGAHYVPLVDAETTEVQRLFEDFGIITGYDKQGLAQYNPYYLCADPQERLYQHGRWQEGLIPQLGLAEADREQITAFFARMESLKSAHGSDGRKLFALPLDHSSEDREWRDLDLMSFSEWLKRAGFTSPPLLWYLNYACRDDFGTTLQDTSAWAGLFYFAARNPNPANSEAHNVLTWPEGNAWLAERLAAPLISDTQTGALVTRIRNHSDGVEVDYWHAATQSARRIVARALVLAIPRTIAARVAQDTRLNLSADGFNYTPWAVANVTLDRPPAGYGESLSWDNVIYDSPLLGYVVATHQRLESVRSATVLTYYWPLTHTAPAAARREAQQRGHDEWSDLFLSELLRIHPELRDHVRHIDVWVWGHGMIRPEPGFIWGEARQRAARHQPPYFFAHSDLSGISVFEEAYTRGVQSADAAAQFLANPARA